MKRVLESMFSLHVTTTQSSIDKMAGPRILQM